jgi:hypothetical protein
VIRFTPTYLHSRVERSRCAGIELQGRAFAESISSLKPMMLPAAGPWVIGFVREGTGKRFEGKGKGKQQRLGAIFGQRDKTGASARGLAFFATAWMR